MKSGGARPFKHLKTSTAHILFLMWFIDGSFTLFLLPFIIFNDRIWMLSNRCFLEGDISTKILLQ